MYGSMQSHLESELEQITAAGLFKSERVIAGAQDVEITLTDGSKVLNFCANNYLGLSSDPRVCEAAKRAIDTHGFGMSSVRFICGTRTFTRNSKPRLRSFTTPKTPFYTPQHSMRMVGYSSRCSARTMPSFPMR